MMGDNGSLQSVLQDKPKEKTKPPLLAHELYALKKKQESQEMDFLKDCVR